MAWCGKCLMTIAWSNLMTALLTSTSDLKRDKWKFDRHVICCLELEFKFKKHWQNSVVLRLLQFSLCFSFPSLFHSLFLFTHFLFLPFFSPPYSPSFISLFFLIPFPFLPCLSFSFFFLPLFFYSYSFPLLSFVLSSPLFSLSLILFPPLFSPSTSYSFHRLFFLLFRLLPWFFFLPLFTFLLLIFRYLFICLLIIIKRKKCCRRDTWLRIDVHLNLVSVGFEISRDI